MIYKIAINCKHFQIDAENKYLAIQESIAKFDKERDSELNQRDFDIYNIYIGR